MHMGPRIPGMGISPRTEKISRKEPLWILGGKSVNAFWVYPPEPFCPSHGPIRSASFPPIYSMNVRGCSIYSLNALNHLAPTAPSTVL